MADIHPTRITTIKTYEENSLFWIFTQIYSKWQSISFLYWLTHSKSISSPNYISAALQSDHSCTIAFISEYTVSVTDSLPSHTNEE
jgi:hypothetical protein